MPKGYSMTLVAVGVFSILTVAPRAQNPGIDVYDIGTMASGPYAFMNDFRAIVTDSGSFAYALIPAATHQTPHYHQQEQVTMGIAGTLDLLVGGVTRKLGTWGAAIPPSNVEHGMVNDGDAPALAVEFQAMRRSDWLAPHTALQMTKSAEPAAVATDAVVNADLSLSSPAWELLANGARVKALNGKTLRVAMWDLSDRNAAVDLPKAFGPRFVFVLQGKGRMTAGQTQRDLGREMLAIVPAAMQAEIRSAGTQGTAIAVFESTAP